jgi:transposase
MARYRPVANQPCFLPVVLSEQLLPGTFEFALNHLIDSGAVPLDGFDAHYRNDEVGAPAVSPAVLLKVVLLGYSRGLVSSRAIASACERHVTFIALCGQDARTSPPWPASSRAWPSPSPRCSSRCCWSATPRA